MFLWYPHASDPDRPAKEYYEAPPLHRLRSRLLACARCVEVITSWYKCAVVRSLTKYLICDYNMRSSSMIIIDIFYLWLPGKRESWSHKGQGKAKDQHSVHSENLFPLVLCFDRSTCAKHGEWLYFWMIFIGPCNISKLLPSRLLLLKVNGLFWILSHPY